MVLSVQKQPSGHALRPSADQLQGNIFLIQSFQKKQLLTYSEENPTSQQGHFQEGFMETLALNSECRFAIYGSMFTGDEWLCVART